MKVLIITYYWPPSGGSGVQRWLKMCKYLPEYGIEPIILTPENPSFINRDPSLLEEVPPGIEVLKLPIWEPYVLLEKLKGKKSHQKEVNVGDNPSWWQRIMLWIRGNLLIPDPRKFWVKPVTRFLQEWLPDSGVQVMVTTGPPHSLHLIGLRIRKKMDVKWVADFRDPWSEWDVMDSFRLSSFARKKHRRLEGKVLRQADHVISVGWEMDKDLRRLGAQNTTVVTNGFDHEDFERNMTSEVRDQSTRVIRHIGTVDELRDPRPFLQAITTAIKEGKIHNVKVKVEFIGNVSPVFKRDVAENEDWKSLVVFREYMPHSEIISLYGKTDLLLLILAHSHSARLNITGKIFEYIASGVPVLGIGDPDGDAARVLRESGRGNVIARENSAGIASELLRRLEQARMQPGQLGSSPYSRKQLAGKVAEIFKSV